MTTRPLHTLMTKTTKAPRWLTALSYASVAGVFGCFIGAAIYSQLSHEPLPSRVFVRLVSAAIISLGLAVGTGLLYAVFLGSVYSGIARRHVTRLRDPLHFWLLLTVIGLLPVALILYGVYKFTVA